MREPRIRIRRTPRGQRLVALTGLVMLVVACGTKPGGSVADSTSVVAVATPSAAATATPSEAAATASTTPSTATAVATASPPTGPGGSVTTFRGNAARTGKMPGPAPSGTPTVAWTFKAGAGIVSAPAVLDRIIYFMGRDGVVHAVSLDTGEEYWKASLGVQASGSLLIADGLLIVGDSAGIVHALAIEDGSSRWTTATDGEISGSGAVQGDVFVVGTQTGTAYAIDVKTGAIRWKTALGGSVSRSVAIAGGIVFLGAGGNLTALALADGKIRWSQAVTKAGAIGTPTAAGGMVYAATGLGGDDPSAYGVAAVDAKTGAPKWRFTSPTQDVVYTPAVVDGRAYVVGEDHHVTALEAKTGKVIWTTVTDQVDEVLAAVVDGQVFIAGNGGAMNALDANTGEIRWSVPYRGVPYGTTVVDGYVLVGTDVGDLVAIRGSAK
jgi:outer membrane protein assembly factor BamB